MYKKSSGGWVKHFDFILLDFICLESSYFFAYVIRHGSMDLFRNMVYRNMFIVLFFIQILVVFFFESFKNILKRGYYREFLATVQHVALVILISSFYLFLMQEGNIYSRATMILTGAIYFVMTYMVRVSWKHYLTSRNLWREGNRSLLVITVRPMIHSVLENIRKDNYEGFRMAGLVMSDGDMEGETIDGIPIVANMSTVAEYVCREWIDEVFIDLPENEPLCEELINQFVAMGVTVHLKLAKVTNIRGQKQFVERLGSYTVLTTSVNMMSARQLFIKRTMDICGGLLGCVITGVLALFIGPAIYIKSPGNIIFSQIRVGKNGRKFKLYKFRSMYPDAEKRKKELMEQNRVGNGLMFKMESDPRIIGNEKGDGKGIGNFIRKTSLDEFPQFWNVLKGDMSLIGTRPPTVDEWEKYELHHRARLAIKPGITGMWQVSGRSDITDFEEVVRLDTEYIENWSIGLDLRLLLKTLIVVLKGSGSM
ncbi:MAG: sugar transferase [Blautia sp.]